MWIQNRQEQQQLLRVDPKIVLSSTLLQMTTAELEQAVENELTDNPALERLEDDPEVQGNVSFSALSPVTISFEDVEHVHEQSFNPDEESDWTGRVISPISLADYLREQVAPILPERLSKIGSRLMESIDDQGYLDMEIEEVALQLNTTLEDVEEALKLLQMCDPPGIGARTIQECMLIQLRAVNFLHYELAEQILLKALDLFTKRDWKKIAKLLKSNIALITQVGEFLLTLNPYPGETFRPSWEHKSSGDMLSVRADVIIRRTEVGYEVDIKGIDPNAFALSARYRECYQQMKNGTSKKINSSEKAHIVEYTERAINFMNSLKQRRETMRSIVQYLIQEQQGFISTGSYAFLRPMTRLQLSKEVGLHESTVSRATMHKFVQLPNQDVIPFEVFFKPSLRIKKAIEQILETEDPKKPLSDEKLVQVLKSQGIDIARRTINKYREQDRILSSRRR